MVRPKKNLGQHFLTDPAIAKRIADALDLSANAIVMEIGPGKGILTKPILERGIHRLIAIEIDRESVEFLQRSPEFSNLTVLEGDFLKTDLHGIAAADQESGRKISVIGNFPYNISSQIFFRILENRDLVDQVVCMVQKEVARRIASPPGSREYGILSVLLQAYFNIEYLFSVKPGSFFPPPKVVSGVIRLRRNERRQLPCDEKLFFRLVKTCFNQRRKTIRNSVKTILLNLEGDSDLLSARPEQLTVENFVELTNLVELQMNRHRDS